MYLGSTTTGRHPASLYNGWRWGVQEKRAITRITFIFSIPDLWWFRWSCGGSVVIQSAGGGHDHSRCPSRGPVGGCAYLVFSEFIVGFRVQHVSNKRRSDLEFKEAAQREEIATSPKRFSIAAVEASTEPMVIGVTTLRAKDFMGKQLTNATYVYLTQEQQKQ